MKAFLAPAMCLTLVGGLHVVQAENATTDKTQNATGAYQDHQDKQSKQHQDKQNRDYTQGLGDERHAAGAYSANDLIGRNVTNAQNEDLGELYEIVIDHQRGEVVYAVLSSGGWLGMGDSLFAVPFSSLDIPNDAEKPLMISADKSHFQERNAFDEENWPQFASQDFRSEVNRQFNVEQTDEQRGEIGAHSTHSSNPVGGKASAGSAVIDREMVEEDDTRQSQTAQANRAENRGDQPRADALGTDQAWTNRLSEIIGMSVVDNANEEVGELSDVKIDQQGTLSYAVIGHGGAWGLADNYTTIKWDQLSIDAQQEVLTLGSQASSKLHNTMQQGDQAADQQGTDRQADRDRPAQQDKMNVEALRTKLDNSSDISADSNVNVSVIANGVVLRGEVETEQEREAIVNLAEDTIDGKVVDRLTVRRQSEMN